MKTPSLALFVSIILAPFASAQSWEVGTILPSGGQVAAPVVMQSLFPGGSLTLPAEVRLSPPSNFASFLSRLASMAATDVVGVTYELAVRATNPSNYPLIWTQTFDGVGGAPQAFALTLRPAQGMDLAGTLRLVFRSTGNAFDGTAFGRTEIDLDGDRVVDVVLTTPHQYWQVTRTWTREMPIALAASGTRTLTLWSEGVATAWSGVASAGVTTNLEVDVARGGAASTVTYGAGCGVTIDGWFETEALTDPPTSRRTAQTSLDGAPPDTPALLVLGTDRTQSPIPGTSCLLYTTPLAVLPMTTTAAGSAQFRTDVPATAAGDVSCQFLTISPSGQILATQGLSLGVR